MKRLKKNILILFMLLAAVVLGGSVEIPHERITENPKVEATTIESKKLKENAKLDITVNKKSIEEIIAYESNGKMMFFLPQDKSIKGRLAKFARITKDEGVIIVKSLQDLPNTTQENQNTKSRMAPFSKEISGEIKENSGFRTVTVEKQINNEPIYIALVDKSTGAISRVFKSRDAGATPSTRLAISGGSDVIYMADSRTVILLSWLSSNGFFSGPTSLEFLGYSVWVDSPTATNNATQATGGFRNREMPLNKYGYYKLLNLDALLTFTFDLWTSGFGQFWTSDVEIDMSNGTFVYRDATEFRSNEGTPPNSSSLNSNVRYNLHNNSYTNESAGVYRRRVEHDLQVQFQANSNFHLNGGINEVFWVIRRDPITASFNLKKSELIANRFSIVSPQIAEVFGYQELFANYTGEAGEAGIYIDNFTNEIVLPDDLPSGEYQIRVNWRINIQGLSIDTPVVTGDNVTINYTAEEISEGTFYDIDRKSVVAVSTLSGNSISPSSWSIEDMRIWTRKGPIITLQGGFTDKEINLTKNGDYRNRALSVSYDNLFSLTTTQVYADNWRFDGGTRTVDNRGLEKITNIKSFNSNGLSMINTDLNINNLMEIKDNSSFDQTSAGLYRSVLLNENNFRVEPAVDGNTNIVGALSTFFWVVQRAPLSETVDIQKTDLTNNRILLNNEKIASKFGYQGSNASYQILNDGGSGIALDGVNLVFPQNLLPGTYKLTIKWEASDPDLNGTYVITDGDELTIDYNTTKIGEVKVIIDPRLKNLDGFNWISSVGNGNAMSELTGSVLGNYPSLLRAEGNFTNLESTIVSDVLEIEDRPNKTSSGAFRIFRTSSGEIDESAMITGVNLNDLRSNLYVGWNNSSDLNMRNNRFFLLGENGKGYLGNIKEEEETSKYYEGVGTVELRENALRNYIRWSPGVTGDAVSQVNSGEPNLGQSVMRLGSGRLFDTRGFGNGSIATRLVVKQTGGSTIEGTGNKLEVVFPENKFGIEPGNGDFFIIKSTLDFVENEYEIIPYYKDVALGKLTLKIVNDREIVDIGEVGFRIDPRLKRVNGGLNYATAYGNIRATVSGANINRYNEMIEITGDFNNLESTNISDIVTIEGRPNKSSSALPDGRPLAVFGTSAGNLVDESLLMTGINLTSLKNELQSSWNNSDNLEMRNNRFRLLGGNEKFYEGNIIEQEGEDKYYEGIGTLDLKDHGVNTSYTWNSRVSGNATSQNGNAVLRLEEGRTIEPRGRDARSITTRLVVRQNGGEPQITNGQVQGQLTVSFPENNIRIENNGAMTISKNDESSQENEYEIIAYHQEVPLGKLVLKIINAREEVDIGEVSVVIDPRLKRLENWTYLRAGGNIYATSPSEPRLESYAELMQLHGNFENLESTNIEDVREVTGRPDKTSSGDFRVFRTSPGNLVDEASILTGIDLNNIRNNIYVSWNNSDNLEMRNNRFKLLGGNEKFYLGNIKEEEGEDKYYEGVATLKMREHSVGGFATWSQGVTGDATAKTSSVPTIMELGATKLFDSRKIGGQGSIATRLVVSRKDGEIVEGTGGAGELEVEFPENTFKLGQNGDFTVIKNDRSGIENEYEIIPYYKDVALGKLTLKIVNDREIVDIGEVGFRIDPRLKRIPSEWNYITAYGNVRLNPYDNNIDRYNELLEVVGNFTNIESTIITDVQTIENRPDKTSVDGHRIFRTSPNNPVDESSLFTGINLNEYRDNLFASYNNSDNLEMRNNRFRLIGANEKFYIGNLKEEESEDRYYEGVGTLEMKENPVDSYSTWESGSTGNASSESDIGGRKVLSIMKLEGTRLFDTKGFGSGSIATRVVVTKNGDETKEETGNGRLQVNFAENSFIIESDGRLSIEKKNDSWVENEYEIIPYYKDIPLGKLTLKIINDRENINIGEVSVVIDPRLKKLDNWTYLRAGGDIFATNPSEQHLDNYIDLMQMQGDFINLEPTNIKDVRTVAGRPDKTSAGEFKVFRTSSENSVDETSILTGIGLDKLKNHLYTSWNNSDNLEMRNNRFKLLGGNEKFYLGNIKEEEGEDKYYEGVGKLQMKEHPVGGLALWEPGETGNAVGKMTEISTVMELGGTRLFDTTKLWGNASIATSMVIKQNGDTPLEGRVNSGEIKIDFKENSFILGSKGELSIVKNDLGGWENDYEIIPYYKDVPLGKLILKIVNDRELINLGRVTFNIDPRLAKLTNWNWITTTGNVTNTIGGPSLGDYSELFELEDTFSNLESTNIEDIREIEGRPNKTSQGDFRIFSRSVGDNTVDESGMLTGINLESIMTNLYVSKNNSTDPKMLHNKFTILGANDQLYLGNIKENYEVGDTPKDGYVGTAVINLSLMRKDIVYSFDKTVSAIGKISSREDGEIKLDLKSGKLPQTHGNKSSNIVTSMKIITDGSEETVVGFYENDNYKIELKATTGDLEITKKTTDVYSDDLVIEYYHQDVKLGALALDIKNNKEVTIVGEDVINFGQIIQGEESVIDSQMKIRSSNKIVTVEIDKDPKRRQEIKHVVSGAELSYTANIINYSSGYETAVGMEIKLNPTLEQEIGNYTGELSLIVTFE
ncbi:MAG: hypothetical protein ACRC6K_04285 [Fusobacteriaceae bacterium]